ncbi:hypothetical protein BV25DRAFT_1165249 [Artomyces pyxidatus]|uniref:Uncharacterized protein n=1 Tax=Artomyces pyxidatus TaxID=48021 RepID=A0ACB8SRJ1_9AGAM|nr:hypothetical protein BV25DRAFT_1165249 [Artomyces pyxidatus]
MKDLACVRHGNSPLELAKCRHASRVLSRRQSCLVILINLFSSMYRQVCMTDSSNLFDGDSVVILAGVCRPGYMHGQTPSTSDLAQALPPRTLSPNKPIYWELGPGDCLLLISISPTPLKLPGEYESNSLFSLCDRFDRSCFAQSLLCTTMCSKITARSLWRTLAVSKHQQCVARGWPRTAFKSSPITTLYVTRVDAFCCIYVSCHQLRAPYLPLLTCPFPHLITSFLSNQLIGTPHVLHNH